MAESERQDKRPSCGWPVPKTNAQGKQVGSQNCGSEQRVYNVAGRGLWTGRPRETPICEKHLPEAWKKWNVDSAVPINPLLKDPLCGAAPHLPLAGGDPEKCASPAPLRERDQGRGF